MPQWLAKTRANNSGKYFYFLFLTWQSLSQAYVEHIFALFFLFTILFPSKLRWDNV